ncbi:MAG: TonB-dependent receptor [Acidobacteriaceae bacterium]|jgi:outer membrane receptor protein involved in Fe transport
MKKLLGLAAVSIGIAMICVAFLAGSTGFAQETNGTIAGSVVDAAGAVVVGASVTATSVDTNDKHTAKTNKVGAYRIESVAPGVYRVEVSADTFAKTTAENVVVNASVVTSVNLTLNPGSATTTVEVPSDVVEALKTDSGELSDTLSTLEVNNLPISTLNPYQLAVTLPGVTTVTGDNYTNGYGFSVNGNRPRDNNFLIEGEDNNDQGLHGQAFQPENLEAVQELTILVDSFAAEYGRGGSVSNLVFKGGSNQFHGAAYELLLNSALDGEDKGDILNQVPKQKSRENIFGFRVGGPIIKDRMFFFVSNIWDRYRSTANLGILTLPTASGFTALQTYATNPRIANLLTAYGSLRGTNALYASTVSLGNDPVSGMNRGVVNFAGVQRQLGDDTNSRELEATSDLIVTDNDRIRFRFIQAPYSVPYDVGNFPNQLPGFDTDQAGVTYNAGIVYTHNFSPNILNELRPAWSRIGFNFALPASTLANPLALTPGIGISGITGYGIPTNVPQGRFQNTYQLEDAVTWIKGTHTMKFGFDIEDQRIKDGIPFNFHGSIGFTAAQTAGYTALANYLDNYGGTASSGTATIQFGNPTARPQIWVQNYYAEDSWKIAHNFTLTFGLRYEYNGTPFNYLPNPAFNPNNPTAFPGGVPELANTHDFGPRAGFNYALNDKTVISAGAGIFYSHIFTNIIDNIQGSSPNAASKDVITSSAGRGTANWAGIIGATFNTPASQLPLATDTSNVIPQHLLEPLTYEYNLRVQRELPAEFVLAVEYVGNRQEHQYATTEFNPFINDVYSAARLFANRGRIIREDNTADSNYNSGQIELQHKVRGGLTFRAAYTYSKLLDDGSEEFTDSSANLSTYAELQYPNNRRREYAASAFDHRNRIVVSAVYQPPKWNAGEGYHWAGAVVNGWTFSGISVFQSGQPINVEIGYDWNGDGISNDRPILLNKNAPIQNWAIKGDDPVVGFGLAPGSLCDGPAWWATNDNCHPVTMANTHWVTSYFGTTQNTVSRNVLFADHASNTDLTVERSFHTFEHQDFRFGVQALNVFNHGPTGSYNSQLIDGVPYNGTDSLGNVYSGAVTFGDKALTVSGNRVLRMNATYEF